MANCLKCGGEGRAFQVMEVQTLHIRDLGGEKRVQALGRFQTYSLCESCARAWLEETLRPWKTLIRRCLPFALILLFGIMVTVLCWNGENYLRLLGFGGLICGVAGLFSSVRAILAKQREYAALAPEEALERAFWDCLLDAAPKKDGDNDLTYIPITDKTLSMKNGDLMIAYDLLPEIAVKAHDLLHGKT